jgi:DNA-binding MarR family transcriptional regulator/N-acetylglutamate synthase-like GNAT family acetyltransferase
MGFFDQTGTMALGSRLRILSERITDDAEKIYNLYDVGLRPKWFPVFYVLSLSDSKSVTEIAEEIGHTHPSVVRIVKEMSKAGVVTENKDKDDGRKNIIELTEKGKELALKITVQYQDVTNAIEEALRQTRHNIWNAIEEMEYLLNQKSLFQRVLEQKKYRESRKVKIVPYEPKYRQHFKNLNEEWITTYFKMEETDSKALEDPEKYILDRGGYILMALYDNEPVGTCALIALEDSVYDFELAKMAVAPKAKGKGIGWLLGQAIIEKAKSVNASSIYLESNTLLKPAISLYQKLGFVKVAGRPSPYERCNIQMMLKLK